MNLVRRNYWARPWSLWPNRTAVTRFGLHCMKNLILGLVLSALSLFGQDLSGSWTLKAQVEDRDGTMQLSLTQRGNSLSGNVVGSKRDYPIKKGSVDGAGKIEIVLGGNKGALAGAKISGEVEGDHLRFTIQMKRGQGEGIASRSQK